MTALYDHIRPRLSRAGSSAFWTRRRGRRPPRATNTRAAACRSDPGQGAGQAEGGRVFHGRGHHLDDPAGGQQSRLLQGDFRADRHRNHESSGPTTRRSPSTSRRRASVLRKGRAMKAIITIAMRWLRRRPLPGRRRQAAPTARGQRIRPRRLPPRRQYGRFYTEGFMGAATVDFEAEGLMG